MSFPRRRRFSWWLYGDAVYSRRGRQRVRRRALGALLSLLLVLGVILFAVWASGHELFGSGPTASQTLVTGVRGAVLTSFQSAAADGKLSAWERNSGLTPPQQKQAARK